MIAAVVLVPAVAFLGLYHSLLEVSVALALLCGLVGLALTMTCLIAFMCSGAGWWLAGERVVGGALFVIRGLLTLFAYELAWRADLYGDAEGAFGVLLAVSAAVAIISPALLAFLKRRREAPNAAA